MPLTALDFPRWLRFQPDRLLQQQLALIDAQANAPVLIGWVTAALTSWVFYRLQAIVMWGAWFAVYTGALALMYAVFAWSRRRGMQPRRRVWIIIGGFALFGLLWGALVVMAAVAGADLPMLALVATVVASIAAAVLGLCGSCWHVYLGYLLLAGVGVNAGLLLLDQALAHVLGVFSCLYVVCMLQFARSVERSALRLIALRFENVALVAELRTQTEQAEAARAQAEASNVDKSRFLAAASHDLRQPVHAMGLFIEALGNTELDPKQRAIHRKAQAACNASGEMLGTLLDFSRIEAAVVKFEPRAFSLQSVLSELAREYEPQAEAKGLHFRLRYTPLWVWSDPSLVSLMVRNFIANAVRYTSSGGLLMGCRLCEGQVRIEVWDSGIGIAAEQHQSIFKEFVQLANAERNRTQGLGLGLAIVQKISEVTGSRITLRSRLGKGSVFAITLAKAEPRQSSAWDTNVDASATPPAQKTLPARLDGLRVLVVEDEPEVREAMAHLLASWGCDYRSAADMLDVAAFLIEWTPEVLLTDYRLRAGVTGRDVMRTVRSLVSAELPAIIVTGDTAPDRLVEAANSGATLLYKPVPAAQLFQALASCGRR